MFFKSHENHQLLFQVNEQAPSFLHWNLLGPVIYQNMLYVYKNALKPRQKLTKTKIRQKTGAEAVKIILFSLKTWFIQMRLPLMPEKWYLSCI